MANTSRIFHAGQQSPFRQEKSDNDRQFRLSQLATLTPDPIYNFDTKEESTENEYQTKIHNDFSGIYISERMDIRNMLSEKQKDSNKNDTTVTRIKPNTQFPIRTGFTIPQIKLRETEITTDDGFLFYNCPTFYVDSVLGNDATGLAYQSGFPFKTINAAASTFIKTGGVNANIVIRAGSYKATNIPPTNATFVCEKGARIINSETTPLFQDSPNTGSVLTILGYANFVSIPINGSPCGPILQISNAQTKVKLECDDIYAEGSCPILVNDCFDFTLTVNNNYNVKGKTKALSVTAKNYTSKIDSITGDNLGIDLAYVNGTEQVESINCPLGSVSYLDYDEGGGMSYDFANRIGSQYINVNSLNVDTLNINLFHSDIAWKTTEANIKTAINVKSLDSVLTSNPTANLTFKKLKAPLGFVNWNRGTLNFGVKLLFDMTLNGYNGNQELVPDGGILHIKGCTEGTSNPTCLFNISRLICCALKVGCDETNSPSHGTGLLDVNIDQAQINKCYVMTKVCSDTILKQFRPKINISGRSWYGLGTIIPQTNGSISVSVKNFRGKNANGGVIMVQDFGTQATENNGVLQITGTILKNEADSVVSTQPLTVVYAPNNVNSHVYIIDCTLSVGLSVNNAYLMDTSARQIEPVYPVEKFQFPPVLKILTYKKIPSRLSGDTVSQPTRWSGSSQYDPTVVYI